jgi:hypothetical protein
MNGQEKKLVLGFVEYLQSVYGQDGTQPLGPPVPANSLLVPMFVGAEPDDLEGVDLGVLGQALGQEPDIGSLLTKLDRLSGLPPGLV